MATHYLMANEILDIIMCIIDLLRARILRGYSVSPMATGTRTFMSCAVLCYKIYLSCHATTQSETTYSEPRHQVLGKIVVAGAQVYCDPDYRG